MLVGFLTSCFGSQIHGVTESFVERHPGGHLRDLRSQAAQPQPHLPSSASCRRSAGVGTRYGRQVPGLPLRPPIAHRPDDGAARSRVPWSARRDSGGVVRHQGRTARYPVVGGHRRALGGIGHHRPRPRRRCPERGRFRPDPASVVRSAGPTAAGNGSYQTRTDERLLTQPGNSEMVGGAVSRRVAAVLGLHSAPRHGAAEPVQDLRFLLHRGATSCAFRCRSDGLAGEGPGSSRGLLGNAVRGRGSTRPVMVRRRRVVARP